MFKSKTARILKTNETNFNDSKEDIYPKLDVMDEVIE